MRHQSFERAGNAALFPFIALLLVTGLALSPTPARATHNCGGTISLPNAVTPIDGTTIFTETAPNSLGVEFGAGLCFASSGINYGGTNVGLPLITETNMLTSAPAVDNFFGGALTSFPVPGATMLCGGSACSGVWLLPATFVADTFAITDTHISAVMGGVVGSFLLGAPPVSAALMATCSGNFGITIGRELCVETTAPAIECVLGGAQSTFPIPAAIVAAPLSWTNGTVSGVVVPTAANVYVISGGVVTPVALPGTFTGFMPSPGGVIVTTTGGNLPLPLAAGVAVIPFGPCIGSPGGMVAINVAPCVGYNGLGVVAGASAGWPPSGADCSVFGGLSIMGGSLGPGPGGPPGASPLGDYGDAPDGGGAMFPTLLGTANSRVGQPGVHHLTTGLEMLGVGVSAELGAVDGTDPDGVPNLINQDGADDGLLGIIAVPAGMRFGVPVSNVGARVSITIAPGAPNVERYLNVLIDINGDLQWRNAAAAAEWVVVNLPVNVAPGTTQTLVVPFGMIPSAAIAPAAGTWSRFTLTRSQIGVAATAATGGWDGSGVFAFGETEDYLDPPTVVVPDCTFNVTCNRRVLVMPHDGGVQNVGVTVTIGGTGAAGCSAEFISEVEQPIGPMAGIGVVNGARPGEIGAPVPAQGAPVVNPGGGTVAVPITPTNDDIGLIQSFSIVFRVDGYDAVGGSGGGGNKIWGAAKNCGVLILHDGDWLFGGRGIGGPNAAAPGEPVPILPDGGGDPLAYVTFGENQNTEGTITVAQIAGSPPGIPSGGVLGITTITEVDFDVDGHRDVIDTEILSMSLTGHTDTMVSDLGLWNELQLQPIEMTSYPDAFFHLHQEAVPVVGAVIDPVNNIIEVPAPSGGFTVWAISATGCGGPAVPDGIVTGSEECDDGNTDDVDACSNGCRSNCGDAEVEASKAVLGCRKAIAKATGKLAKTADKLIAKCHKAQQQGGVEDTVDCNDLSQADPSDKMEKALEKLTSSVAKRCPAPLTEGADLLRSYAVCPVSPCTGVSGESVIADFEEVGACLGCIGTGLVETMDAENLGNPDPLPEGRDAKCHQAIAKGYGKYLKTILKVRDKCQQQSDKEGITDITACSTADSRDKIERAKDKAETLVDKACKDTAPAGISPCAAATLADLKVCLAANTEAAAAEQFAANYEFCPVF